MDVIGWIAPGTIRIVKDAVTMDVPDDFGNLERNEIAEWVAAGNTIPDPHGFAPAPPEPEPKEDDGEEGEDSEPAT